MAGVETVDESLEQYHAQLKQVEAALLIDESNEDLKKLKQDLQEVITLSEELKQINEVEEPTVEKSLVVTEEIDEVVQWKSGDRVQAVQTADGEYHNATIDMISDDGVSCSVKFDNLKYVEIVKVNTLKTLAEKSRELDSGDKAGVKLSRDELERRREIKKKKLLKKKQRMKDFEEKRESEKQRWQTFFKKGTGKGKNKVKGLKKKSIFASREDGKGKIGVGTCGTSGNSMTSYTPASSYMYKK